MDAACAAAAAVRSGLADRAPARVAFTIAGRAYVLHATREGRTWWAPETWRLQVNCLADRTASVFGASLVADEPRRLWVASAFHDTSAVFASRAWEDVVRWVIERAAGRSAGGGQAA